MKFLHLSDLHLGKRVNEFSMLEDQRYILMKILEIIDQSSIDCVIIAGDIYDKPIPPAEAVGLFDEFLTFLAERKLTVLAISGNHDSAERIAFGSEILHLGGVYMSPVFNGKVTPVKLNDSFGELNVYMLPFVKPAQIKRFFEEEKIENYNDALKAVIGSMELDKTKRNLLIAHQFVTGAARCESEEIFIGGLDNVDAEIFADFDYVALGHLHSPQSVTRDEVRYCGTPLKYSFSEVNHKKSVSVVTLSEKGKVDISCVPLIPRRDMRILKGKFEDIVSPESYKDASVDDYIKITLTDEDEIPEGMHKLRSVYPNVMVLDYDNKRSRQAAGLDAAYGDVEKTPMENFSELYKLQNNDNMSEEQSEYLASLIESIWEGEDETD